MASKFLDAEDYEGAQKTTRDKYKTIARAQSLNHDELMDHVQSHMLGCTDPDCDICDMGESGSMIDNDDEYRDNAQIHDIGSRSSKGREGAGEDIDTIGKRTQSEIKGDKENLMKHGEHTSKHPGFKAVQSKIASQQGLSKKAAGAILAARSRSASVGAKRANPRLKRVRG